MTLESSAVIMDEVFSSSEDSARVRLLKIIQDFLSAEADKNAALLKGKCIPPFTILLHVHVLWCRLSSNKQCSTG
jgi:hypothetical protein